jgi:hypothetical protein
MSQSVSPKIVSHCTSDFAFSRRCETIRHERLPGLRLAAPAGLKLLRFQPDTLAVTVDGLREQTGKKLTGVPLAEW